MSQKKQQKHVLIDALNIIHKWLNIRDLLQNRGLEAAVDILLQRVRIIHDVEEVRLSLVVDGRGRAPEVIYPSKEDTLAVIFAPGGLTADGLIEQMVRNSKYSRQVTVASEDRALGQVVSSLGALVISAQGLLEWVEACERRQTERLTRKSKESLKKWKESDHTWDKLK